MQLTELIGDADTPGTVEADQQARRTVGSKQPKPVTGLDELDTLICAALDRGVTVLELEAVISCERR